MSLFDNERVDIESIKHGPYMNYNPPDDNSPLVKFVDCFYKREVLSNNNKLLFLKEKFLISVVFFQKLEEFCRRHFQLRKLKLRKVPGYEDELDDFTSFSHLRYLTSLSIDFRIIIEAGKTIVDSFNQCNCHFCCARHR